MTCASCKAAIVDEIERAVISIATGSIVLHTRCLHLLLRPTTAVALMRIAHDNAGGIVMRNGAARRARGERDRGNLH